MGNAFSSGPVPQPPARAKDDDGPEKERRQVYREAYDGRVPMHVLQRRRLRDMLRGVLQQRPATRVELYEVRVAVLAFVPSSTAACSTDECALSGDARVALAILESLETRSRTLSDQEGDFLAAFLADDKEVRPEPKDHRLSPPARWSTCECRSPSCAECRASPFRRVPKNISALDLHFKSSMNASRVVPEAESHADAELF